MEIINTKDKEIFLMVPPAYDWTMPTLALPLLKSCLQEQGILSQILDINQEFMNFLFPEISEYKKDFFCSLQESNLKNSISAGIKIAEAMREKKLNDVEFISNNSIEGLPWKSIEELVNSINCNSAVSSILKNILKAHSEIKKARIICLSISVEAQVLPSFILMRLIREMFTGAKIVIGGNIVTRQFEFLQDTRLLWFYDYKIKGEGEKKLVKAIKDILSMGTCDENELERLGEVDINSLPIPDFSDINISNYIISCGILPISLNRCCTWNKCDFCSISSTWESGHREKNISNVIEEIINLKSRYGVRHFRIIDEEVNPRLLGKFARAIINQNIKITYEAYCRFDTGFLDKDLFFILYKSGCRQIFWGIENINDEALVFMNKGTSSSKISRILNLSSDVGILNYCFILTGIPQISVESEKETFEYAKSMNSIHVVAMGTYVVDRHSPMHLEESIREKYKIHLYEIGELTTEIGYTVETSRYEEDQRYSNAEKYISELFCSRPDLALNTLLLEEIKFILLDKFNNDFAKRFIDEIDANKKDILIKEATERALFQRVYRGQRVDADD